MADMVRIRRPPQPLNLRGRATLAISVKQDAVGGMFRLEMAVVIPPRGRGRVERRVLSKSTAEDETQLWRTLRDLAESRLVDLAEINMEPPDEANAAQA